MRRSALGWAAWAALACLLLRRLWGDYLLLPGSCDTTYIWEGYEEVPLGGKHRYRLIKFADRDPETTAAHAKSRQQGVPLIPVLFVHGHLGTHQQMRSAAAETGRELARRAFAAGGTSGSGSGAPPLWMQWYAADFNAEASALDGALPGEQAGFVLRCIEHLRQQHAAASPPATAAAAAAAGTPAEQEQQQEQPGGQPFRLMLVAYSMGGLVARQALLRLAADPAFDMGQIVALVTLGSPDRFPAFMPHTPLASYLAWANGTAAGRGTLSGSGSRDSSGGSHASEAAVSWQVAARAASVPGASVLAGSGDFSVPQTHPFAGGALPGRAPAAAGGWAAGTGSGDGGNVVLQMRDMPGVWTTCSHKAIVSCNQLVRLLVPLLVDASLASLDTAQQYHGTAQRQAAVQGLLRRRLATNLGQALALEQPTAAGGLGGGMDDTAASRHGGVAERHPSCGAVASGGGEEAWVSAGEAEQVDGTLVRRSVPAGSALRLSWDAGRALAAGQQGLLILATAAAPCSQLSVIASWPDGSSAQLAGRAAPLPPLLPSLQRRWVPRHWQESMAGVDWQQNATRLLYVPFRGGHIGSRQAAGIELAVRGAASGATSLLAQALPGHPAGNRAPLRLPPPGSGRAAGLPAGHAAAVRLQLPAQAWPLGACTAEGGGLSLLSLRCLGQLLLGGAPPWSLRVSAQHCGGPAGDAAAPPDGSSSSCSMHGQQLGCLLPALLAHYPHSAAGDSVRLAGSTSDSCSNGSCSVSLWDGLGPLERLLLVSDPACTYTAWLEWDLSGWLGRSLRHLLIVLPALCMAASLARLSPLPGTVARVAFLAALLAAWGSQHPRMLRSLVGGTRAAQPWVELSAVEALAALAIAAGGASLCGMLTAAFVRLLARAVPAKPLQRAQAWGWLALAVVAAASLLVPPAVPFWLGCLCLAARLAAAARWQRPAPAARTGSKAGLRRPAMQPLQLPGRPLGWLVLHSQLVLLPAVELASAWLGSARRLRPVGWMDGRLMVCALALHACCLPCVGTTLERQRGRQRRRQKPLRQALLSTVHEAAGLTAAVASLWGHPWLLLWLTACAAAAEALLCSWV